MGTTTRLWSSLHVAWLQLAARWDLTGDFFSCKIQRVSCLSMQTDVVPVPFVRCTQCVPMHPCLLHCSDADAPAAAKLSSADDESACLCCRPQQQPAAVAAHLQPCSRTLLLSRSHAPVAGLRLRLLSWLVWQGVLQPSCTASGQGMHGQLSRYSYTP